MLLGTLWACTDCLFAAIYAEPNPDRPADLPPVLSLLLNGQHLSPGLSADEHADTCTEADREHGCDCVTKTLSRASCDTCGDNHDGDRHAMALFVHPPYRALTPADLSDEECPTCGHAPCEGTLTIADRGPYQQISCRHMRCAYGHRWTRDTDGG